MKHSPLFSFRTRNSFYACSVSEEQRLVFNGWAPCAEGEEPILETARPPLLNNWISQDNRQRCDEVTGVGDEALQEPSIFASVPEAAVAEHEAPYLPARHLALRFVAHRRGNPEHLPAGAPRHGRSPEFRGGDWHILSLRDELSALEVDLCIRARPEVDVIERYLILRNTGSQTLELKHAWAASLQLPFGQWDLTQLCGAWGIEFQRKQQPLPLGSTLLEHRSINTGLGLQPYVLLQPRGRASRVSGLTYGAQLAWSGHWRIHIEQHHSNRCRIHLGEHPEDSRRSLAPGEHLATPMVLMSCSEQGEEGVARNFRRYHRYCSQPKREALRPVLYNSWEAAYFNLSMQQQLDLAKQAAELGVELFVVDDGWFGGRRHDRAGLGDWVVSREVFPDGLKPLSDAVHALGMKFGLWFEPEMVNPDSDLYREHPEWVQHYPGRERSEGRNQLILDFGNPEVVKNIRSQMEAVLDECPVDFIKWDLNRSVSEAGSFAGEQIWRRHVEALHGLMDHLLKRYPGLDIQSCSSGGGRVDAAMMTRNCQFWTSDNTDAHCRIAIQDGFTLGYPQDTMECWVTFEKNHQTSRICSLDFRFAMAMRGVLGIGSDVSKLPPEEAERYRMWISFYKQIRHLVQGGRLHRAALPELDDELSVWQFTAPDGKEAYVSLVMRDYRLGSHLVQYRLADLDPDAMFVGVDEQGIERVRARGRELMAQGLPAVIPDGGNLCPGHVRHLHLTTA